MPDEKDPAQEPDQLDDVIEIEFLDEESGLQPVEESPSSPDGEEELSIQEEVDHLKNELDHVRDIYLRKLAEFDNFRKRTEREREDFQQTAGEDLVKELLPVLDNFERALQQEKTDSGAFRDGIEMIARQFWDTLQRKGLEVVNPEGQPFDPELHEAVQRVEAADHAPGTVVWVMLKGYTFGDRLIRPAMVGVAVEPQGPESVGGSAF
ncbi:MAG: nucleotide exchange factor GrpE [Acidobacteria bacterium]|nr:nucleotide exchange factor GrpE [Acidobacteriota bacterium]